MSPKVNTKDVNGAVKKRKRKQISHETKIAILEKLKAGVKPCQVAKDFGIKYSTIIGIKYNEAVIRAQKNKKNGSRGKTSKIFTGTKLHRFMYTKFSEEEEEEPDPQKYVEALKRMRKENDELDVLEANKSINKYIDNLRKQMGLDAPGDEYKKQRFTQYQRRGTMKTSKVAGHHTAFRSGRKFYNECSSIAEERPELVEDELSGAIRKIGDLQPNHLSDWQQRRQNSEVAWSETRAVLFEWELSQKAVPVAEKCGLCYISPATIKCNMCRCLLCSKCDQDEHTKNVFHDRLTWIKGFYEPLAPGVSVLPDGKYIEYKPIIAVSCGSCPNCSNGKLKPQISDRMCIFVTLSGRFDLYVPVFFCDCGFQHQQLGCQMLAEGYFSSCARRTGTFYDIRLFELWNNLKRFSPGTSLQSLLRSLEAVGSSHNRHGPINFEAAKRAFNEWRFMQHELGKLQEADEIKCAACNTSPFAIHIDGNKKLYRFEKIGRGIRESYYLDTIFADDAAVQHHVANIDSLKTKSQQRCGVSKFKAARNTPQSNRVLDETGISVATCRHGVIHKAVNFYHGELYDYAHFLQMKYFPKINFLCQDIICKYFPWALKIAAIKPEFGLGNTKPFLGVLHANGHSWFCQVLYGARWQEGSGLTSGEETEQVFSYLSRYNSTTKNMLRAERLEELTEAALFWNHRKLESQGKSLIYWFNKAKNTEKDSSKELISLGFQETEVKSWCTEIRQLAEGLSNRKETENAVETEIEAVCGVIRHRKSLISNYAVSNKMRSSLRTKIEEDKKKLKALIEKYNENSDSSIAETDVMEGLFPWHLNGVRKSEVTFQVKRNTAEKMQLRDRSREEQHLLKKEMFNYISFYNNRSAVLDKWISELSPSILPSCLNEDPKKYTLQAPLCKVVVRGIHAVLKHGQYECLSKLAEAKQLFNSVLCDEDAIATSCIPPADLYIDNSEEEDMEEEEEEEAIHDV